MARCTIQPGVALSGSITPPASYGHALRLIWAACLGAGGVIGNCPDRPAIRALLDAGRSMGAEPVFEENVADIFGPGGPYPPDRMPCGGNTYATRMALPLACLFGSSVTLADIALPAPASKWLLEASQGLGMRISNAAGQITLAGPPAGDALLLADRAGAFWAPGWMMAAPLSDQTLLLDMDDFVHTHPAVSLTLAVLDQFGIVYNRQDNENGSLLTIAPLQEYRSIDADVEADWRTGSYLLAALLLAGNGEVALSSFSSQPERAFWKLLDERQMLLWSEDGLKARPQGHRKLDLPPTLDPRPYPALLPLLIVLATQAANPVRIGPLTPVSPRTRNRARAMGEALTKLGATLSIGEEWIDVTPSKLTGGIVDSQGDARVAMALGLAGLVSSKTVVIEDAQAVSTVHAGFWADLRRLGAQATLTFERSMKKEEPPRQPPSSAPPSGQSKPPAATARPPASPSSSEETPASPDSTPAPADDLWHSI